MMMKRLLMFVCINFALSANAQTTAEQIQQADNLYKQFKEEEALNIYKQVAAQDTDNITALIKCVELNCSIGERQVDKNMRKTYFNSAKEYADKALAANSNSAEANYAEALAFGKLSSMEEEKKKIVEDVKQIKLYADRSVAINPDYSRANYVAGKWHYEMLALNWFKKAALKTFYGKGLTAPDIDSAITFMEKCRAEEPYFVQNYFDLAKAYGYKNRPAQEMDILSKMIRLPNRTADDAALKEQGKKLLQSLQ